MIAMSYTLGMFTLSSGVLALLASYKVCVHVWVCGWVCTRVRVHVCVCACGILIP